MNIIQIAFDAQGKSTVTLTKNIQQGDHLTNKLRVTFYEGHPTISTVRLHAQKPDGSVTPIITSFESALQDDIWEYKLESWFTEYAGILTISVSVQFAGEVEGYETADIILYDDYAALEAAAVTDDTKALVTLDDSKVFVYDTDTSTYEEQTGLSYEIPKEYQRSIKLSIEKSVISSGTSNLPPTSEPYILLLINNNATRISILENTTNDHEERLDAAEPIIASNTNRIVTLESDKADKTELAVETLRIDRILDGTTIVPKAYSDEDGVNIKENYVRIGDYPNTPVLDENNKLPNSYLKDDVLLESDYGTALGVAQLDSSSKLPNATLQDDVAIIDSKNDKGVVFYDATSGKLNTDTVFKYTPETSFELNVAGIGILAIGALGFLLQDDEKLVNISTQGTSGITINAGNGETPLTINTFISTPNKLQSWKLKGVEKAYIDKDGNLSIGSLNVAGDIIQQGAAYETHAEQVYTTNDTIILRDGAVAGLAVGAYAGLFAKLADGTNDSAFVFDGNGMARVGDISYDLGVPNYSNTQALATRQDTPTSNAIAYWNASAYRFDTSSGLTTDLGDNANAGLLINKSAGAGNIANFQFGGTNKLEITKDGFINQNGTRFIHNYGISNTSVGKNSLSTSTTGSYNSSFGEFALSSNISGAYNDAFGFAALLGNLSGAYNVAFGSNAGRYIADGSTARTTGNYGLYLGRSAKASADGTTNEIVIGFNAIGKGSNTAAFGNTDTSAYYFNSKSDSVGYFSKLNVGAATGVDTFAVKGSFAVESGTNVLKVLSGNSIYSTNGGNLQYWNGTAVTSALSWISSGNVGIGETSPTAQLQVKSSATDKVGLIVDMPTSATANIQEWKVNGTSKAYINSSGQLQVASGGGIFSPYIYNIASGSNAAILLNTSGTTIQRNIADADSTFAALKINNQLGNGDIVKFQYGGSDVLRVDNGGRIYTRYGIYNLTNPANILNVGTSGTTISRNVASGTAAALYVDQTNATATGNIAEFQFNSTTKLAINKDGVIVDNDASAGTDGQVLQKVSGKMVWTTKSGTYAGPTDTYLGSRFNNGALTVADIDAFDEIILEMYGLDQDNMQQTLNRCVYPASALSTWEPANELGDKIFISARSKAINGSSFVDYEFLVRRNNTAGTELDIYVYHTATNDLYVKIYGRNW